MEYFFVYILQCSDQSYYTGHTDDIEKRLAEHLAGMGSLYTKKRLPVKLVFCQQFTSRAEALELERRIKPWSRRKKEALIAGAWHKVSFFAKKKFQR